ncbi:MAG: GTP cyclohydrolase II [Gammaproteobacteria bacterium]|nr:GTP cyclohydrolase II [Gammaproteobacteria bacterium]
MFTYLNPSVREKLIDQGQLFRINELGESLDIDAPLNRGELTINLLGPIPLPLSISDEQCHVDWYAAVRGTELDEVEELAEKLRLHDGQNLFANLAKPMAVNSVLIIGNALESKNPLVRVHSNCLTGDVFGSLRCECGPQLNAAIQAMNEEETGGVIIYMAGHEGRGIGLWAKAATYLLQDSGENTYQANQSLGLPADSRDFSDAAALLLHFIGNRPMRLLTNNPKKVDDLTKAGLTELTVQKHIAGVTPWNRKYLYAKKAWGHHIHEDDLDQSQDK